MCRDVGMWVCEQVMVRSKGSSDSRLKLAWPPIRWVTCLRLAGESEPAESDDYERCSSPANNWSLPLRFTSGESFFCLFIHLRLSRARFARATGCLDQTTQLLYPGPPCSSPQPHSAPPNLLLTESRKRTASKSAHTPCLTSSPGIFFLLFPKLHVWLFF